MKATCKNCGIKFTHIKNESGKRIFPKNRFCDSMCEFKFNEEDEELDNVQ